MQVKSQFWRFGFRCTLPQSPAQLGSTHPSPVQTQSQSFVWEKSSIFFYICDYGNKTYMRFYMHLCLKTSVESTAMSKYNLLYLIPAEGVPSHFYASPLH